MNKSVSAFILAILLTFVFSSNFAFAQGLTSPRQATQGAQRPAVKALLEGAKLQACRTKYSAILNRSKNLSQKGASMLERIDRVSQRVQGYYTDRLTTFNVVIPNYEEMVADINTKRAVISPLVEKARVDGSSISCDSSDPRGQISVFREDMLSLMAALKEYRLSVRTLVQAVIKARADLERTPNASTSGEL